MRVVLTVPDVGRDAEPDAAVELIVTGLLQDEPLLSEYLYSNEAIGLFVPACAPAHVQETFPVEVVLAILK